MYEVADRLDPDSYLRLARAAYSEMAVAGFTAVGEFHYLHHDAGGVPYADPNAMGHALVEAARQAGIRLTLLDACYLRGGLEAPSRAAVALRRWHRRRLGRPGGRASQRRRRGARLGAGHPLRAGRGP